MEERRADRFLWVDLILAALAAARIYSLLAQCQEYLSFAGFAALLGMVVLAPGFLCLIGEIVLLFLGSRGLRRGPMAAYLLQIAAGAPSAALLAVDAEIFGELWVYPALMVLGILGAVRELSRRSRGETD